MITNCYECHKKLNVVSNMGTTAEAVTCSGANHQFDWFKDQNIASLRLWNKNSKKVELTFKYCDDGFLCISVEEMPSIFDFTYFLSVEEAFSHGANLAKVMQEMALFV
jgi:hypothetical protein